jgi:hypothetical protein
MVLHVILKIFACDNERLKGKVFQSINTYKMCKILS